FYLFNCRSLSKSISQLGLLTNMWAFGGAAAMLLLQILYTYLPVMNRLFQSEPIGLVAWGKIMAAGLLTYIIVEVEKKLWQRSARD
ncbi:MAG: cation transporting ATPase C-terminal domain-containing protein, partial [Thermodesulfobacteriota bacterium]